MQRFVRSKSPTALVVGYFKKRGVTNRLWEVADLVAAWQASERRVE